MEIHELNTIDRTPGATDFLPLDSGFDTMKISAQELLKPVKSSKVNIPLDENNHPDNGNPGQLLRTNGDGSTKWVDEGLPTDEQTASAVSAWLDDHPETTTTVMDGSLTYKKLVPGTLGFVTPQMYGAKADGVTDDTMAFQEALLSSHYVYVPSGTYIINGDNSGWGHLTEGGIMPQSDSNIIMSNNAILKAKTNSNGFYNVLNLK